MHEKFFPSPIAQNTPEFYKLDLTRLIEEQNNPEYHGRVRAYFNHQFMLFAASRSFSLTETLSFQDYLGYISADLHELQRSKYKAMEAMVDLINAHYKKNKRTFSEHASFCKELLVMVDFCMSTSQKNCDQILHDSREDRKADYRVFDYWKSIMPRSNSENIAEQEKYTDLLHHLLLNFKKAVFIQNALEELKTKFNNRSNKQAQGICISWTYFAVMCNLARIGTDPVSADLLDKVQDHYRKEKAGLANDLFYVVDFREFLIKMQPKHKQNPLGELLKKIEKMMERYPVFSESKPEENRSFSRGLSLTR